MGLIAASSFWIGASMAASSTPHFVAATNMSSVKKSQPPKTSWSREARGTKSLMRGERFS